MTSSVNKSSPTRSDVRKSLFLLLGLIEAQDWVKFKKAALPNPKTFRLISKAISEFECFNGMTLLHGCVRFEVPIAILDEMITLYPHALHEVDCMGRTPLHVAAGSSASPMIIKRLTIEYPQACAVQDEDGMTPLHFACDTTCQLFEDGKVAPRGPPSLMTVRILLAGSLEAVIMEDVDEMNPIEYALFSDASMDVINLLQRASLRTQRKKNKNSGVRSTSPFTRQTNVRSERSVSQLAH